jgi:hypothetical protein
MIMRLWNGAWFSAMEMCILHVLVIKQAYGEARRPAQLDKSIYLNGNTWRLFQPRSMKTAHLHYTCFVC